MGKPAGAQLKRWFNYLVLLLLVVNVSAVFGAVLTRITVLDVTDRYQPFQVATATVEMRVVSAQRDMFEYLSELSDSPDKALSQLDKLTGDIKTASLRAPENSVRPDLNELTALLGQYRTAIEQLPAIMEGERDWARLEEMSSTAIRYGDNAAKLASKLSVWAQAEIASAGRNTSLMTTIAMYGLIGLFAASLFVMMALKFHWKRFQDIMLGL